jgi:AcrR family transcriptional regulator
MTRSRRDHLLDTALALFYRRGFHATGIDTVLAEAGVAKMTLYNHFRSKDELIAAALERRDRRFRAWFVERAEALAQTPRGRLLALFDVLAEWFAQPGFQGCMFINAAAEFRDPGHPAPAAAAEHKALLEAYVRGLAAAAGAAEPERLAGQLVLLMDGAITARQVRGDGAARLAREAAEVLVDRAIGPHRS